MASELERLLVKLEADTSQLRAALSGAESAIGKFQQDTGRSFDRAAKSANAYGVYVQAALTKAATGFAAYLTVAKALEAIDTTAELDRDAKAAGLTAAAWQELAYAASTIGVQYNQLIGISGQFASNLGELRTKSGGLYEFLSRHHKTLLDNLTATKSVSEAYGVYADAVAALTSAEERTILTAKGFGEEGRKLVEVFADGSAGLAEMRLEAHQLGVVLDASTIAAAKRTSYEFNKISTLLSTTFKSAVVSVADAFRELFAQGKDDQLYTWATSTWPVAEASAKDLARMVELLSLRIQYLQETAGSTDEVDRLTGRLVELTDAYGKVAAAATAATGPLRGSISNPTRLTEKPVNKDFSTSLDFASVDRLAALERRRLAAVQDTTGLIGAEYAAELESFRRLLADKQISEEEFVQAREALNETAGAKIKEEFERERRKLLELGQLIESSLAAPLDDAFNNSLKSADQYFATMLQGFSKLILQAAVLKPLVESITSSLTHTGLGSLFGSFGIAGARAGGGPVSPGKPYLVGERGPEIIVPNSAANVLPNGVGLGGNKSTTVYNIDARGADIGVAERIERALQAAERSRREPVKAVSDYRSRYPTRGL